MIQALSDAVHAVRSLFSSSSAADRRSQATGDAAAAAAATAATTTADATAVPRSLDAPILLNPKITWDSDTEQLLVQFRDQGGKVVNQIPTEKQLAAYRQTQEEERRTRNAVTGV